MSKFTDYFLENYRCVIVDKRDEYVDKNGNIVVSGNCSCQSDIDVGNIRPWKNSTIQTLNSVCSWEHIIDKNGNVVKSTETNCPCVINKQNRHTRVLKTNYKRLTNGKFVTIAVFVTCGILILVGVICLLTKHIY